MASCAGQFVCVPADLLPLALFLLGDCILRFGDYLDSRWFAPMPRNRHNRFVQDLHYGINQVIAAGARMMRLAQ